MKYKELYKKIEETVALVAFSKNERELIRHILDAVMSNHGTDLGILSGRLYVLEGNLYRLTEQIGIHNPDSIGVELPIGYLPIRRLRESKYIVMRRHEQGLDRKLEDYLVVDTFAAIALGENDKYLVSFSVTEPVDEDQLHYSLNTIRFVTNFKLRELVLQNEIMKASEVQVSLLPSSAPELPGYDIFGESRAAAQVGGDGFDYININDDTLGIAILDAVGHGLSAALQARDVITGLRMGAAGNIKIDQIMQRLNLVIHRSNLASRFASLFYCELEEYGHMVYSNAGHPPAIFFSGDQVHLLQRGGMVLGPNPKARYYRGFAYLQPGDILVLYSDGITEVRNSEGQEYGIDRLIEHVRKIRDRSARDIIRSVYNALSEFAESTIPQDDQTILIIKRSSQINNPF